MRTTEERGADRYWTPEWITEALLREEQFEGRVWEPACGTGAIVRVLWRHDYDVYATDLQDYGFTAGKADFLECAEVQDNIVTNPPFKLAEEFARKAWELSERKSALLLRLAFLEGQKRYTKLFSQIPPSRIWVLSRRATLYPPEMVRKGSGTIAMAWFVWDKEHQGAPTVGWCAHP